MEFGSGIFVTKQSKAMIATNEEQSVGSACTQPKCPTKLTFSGQSTIRSSLIATLKRKNIGTNSLLRTAKSVHLPTILSVIGPPSGSKSKL